MPEETDLHKINWENDAFFNDEFTIDTDPEKNIDLTGVDMWSDEQKSAYRKTIGRKNMRELIVCERKRRYREAKRERQERADAEAEAKQKAADKRKLIMAVLTAAAAVVGTTIATNILAKWMAG